mmetsp:Transcript_5958/g.11164  ORF Transcript_5958/g.11164 Transcript_5958/m.11164 type:complete len:495 (+) Transcript_5958:72-1556(+)
MGCPGESLEAWAIWAAWGAAHGTPFVARPQKCRRAGSELRPGPRLRLRPVFAPGSKESNGAGDVGRLPGEAPCLAPSLAQTQALGWHTKLPDSSPEPVSHWPSLPSEKELSAQHEAPQEEIRWQQQGCEQKADKESAETVAAAAETQDETAGEATDGISKCCTSSDARAHGAQSGATSDLSQEPLGSHGSEAFAFVRRSLDGSGGSGVPAEGKEPSACSTDAARTCSSASADEEGFQHLRHRLQRHWNHKVGRGKPFMSTGGCGGNDDNKDEEEEAQAAPDRAEASSEEARPCGVAVDPDDYQLCLSQRRAALRQDGEFGAALRDALELFSLAPESQTVLFGLAVSRLESGGQDQQALAEFRSLQRLGASGLPELPSWLRRARHWAVQPARRNHYRALGVPADATASAVRQAYRRAALNWHPDRPGGDAARFHAAQEAWELLGSETLRNVYDFGAVADPSELMPRGSVPSAASATPPAERGRAYSCGVDYSRSD